MILSFIAQIFNGGGTSAGITEAGAIGVADTPLRETIINFLLAAINLLALLAVIAIIVGGVYLVGGMGTEDSRERAKRIILYTIIGLLVILFSRVIVGFIINL